MRISFPFPPLRAVLALACLFALAIFLAASPGVSAGECPCVNASGGGTAPVVGQAAIATAPVVAAAPVYSAPVAFAAPIVAAPVISYHAPTVLAAPVVAHGLAASRQVVVQQQIVRSRSFVPVARNNTLIFQNRGLFGLGRLRSTVIVR